MHRLLLNLIVAVIMTSLSSASRNDTDIVTDLPGLTFDINFKHYSGYLNATAGNYLHYWLVESQSNPTTDPLILWLNGGPGCSSLGGFMTELGPFHPNFDGTTLYENVFSWNKGANVLFLEAPRDVGFSYRDPSFPKDIVYNDNKTVEDSFLALKDFFTSYTQYQTRDFYVSGESYGGVYVPTLTARLIHEIQKGTLPAKLVGMAVGNGELSEYQQINSAIILLYAHGMYGRGEFDRLMQCCPGSSLLYCNFAQYINLDDQGNAVAKPNSGVCGQLVEQMGFDRVWITQNDVYNLYQDCYNWINQTAQSDRRKRFDFDEQQQIRAGPPGFVDQNTLINSLSTDHLGTFPCYMDQSTENYLNLPAVRQALHIPTSVPHWSDCNDFVNGAYIQQNHDTTPVFVDMLTSGYPFHILIYNGDVDSVCNFLGDEWFVEAIVAMPQFGLGTTAARAPWTYQTNAKYDAQIAGYRKSFGNGVITLDLVTVKGAGHFVPTDRPGPALQMITNFIKQRNYSTLSGYDATPRPLKPQYQPNNPTATPTAASTSSAASTPTAAPTSSSRGSESVGAISVVFVLICALVMTITQV